MKTKKGTGKKIMAILAVGMLLFSGACGKSEDSRSGSDGNETSQSVSEGYESTGIYALTAMIGMECNNSEMVTLSIARMNEFRIFDSANRYNGAFGNADGSGIYSFDQCMALKAYALLESYCR